MSDRRTFAWNRRKKVKGQMSDTEKKIYPVGTRGDALRLKRRRRYEIFVAEDGSLKLYDMGKYDEVDEADARRKYDEVELEYLSFEVPAVGAPLKFAPKRETR
jgi:hypothetical protein